MIRNLFISFIFLFSSCIPTKIAPKFKDQGYKVMYAKKLDRDLEKELAFVFIDPKDAGEFYNYINTKYGLNDIDVGINVPVQLQNETLFLTYQEIENEDENLNLPFALVDAKRESEGKSKLFENNYTNRKGYWYIVISLYDEQLKNCLKENHKLQPVALKYLKALKEEYFTTQNYLELLLNKKS